MTKRRNPYAGADERTLSAKAKGYPARSVWKLEEIDRRFRLLKAGQHVLDLGAAPGSWSMYASEKVGQRGAVLAVDLSAIEQDLGKNVTVLQADALDLGTEDLAVLGPYDVVLSDMAPRTSGSKVSDQAQSFELCMRALEVALALGKPGSHFVGKLFMSEDFRIARQRLATAYEEVHTVRPSAVRSVSSEVFLVGKGKKPSPP